ncbi:spore germination protein [Cohnella cholangitidis]|uniref:Spore germination protein n=1 Tax=Cohnella cholangitidis TaxID=2598458 RepID=A0A7G5C5W7_9BACL|nr:spore germination protein [Cohnella cholangitidis]QMV44601.1 spore germination protein [Cohnella cholangitidis]
MSLSKPMQTLVDAYAHCADVRYSSIPLGIRSNITLLYCKTLCDEKMINRNLLPEFKRLYSRDEMNTFEEIEKFAAIQIERLDNMTVGICDDLLFKGTIVIEISHLSAMFAYCSPQIPVRQTEETNIEVSIRGPKDGFVESVDTNLALIRRRLPVNTVAIETMRVGTKTRTRVSIVYDTDKINPGLLNDIRVRLRELSDQIEELNSATQLEERISDHPYSLFPLSIYTGRPDFLTSCVLRGRFALLIDGVPGAMIGPATLTMLLKTPEDNHFNYISSSFGQLLRLLSLLVAMFLPSFYIALTGYHQDQIPFPLLATIVNTRFGVPFSTPMEMFLVLTLLETFKEAGYRLPSMIGQTLTVVGGLIIGEAAIRAGLTSPSMVVIAAISIVSGSTLISQTLSGSVSIIRYAAVFLSSLLGMYGFMISVIVVIVYLSGLSSYGVSYIAPFAPVSLKDIGRSILNYPRKLKSFVPKYLNKKP